MYLRKSPMYPDTLGSVNRPTDATCPRTVNADWKTDGPSYFTASCVSVLHDSETRRSNSLPVALLSSSRWASVTDAIPLTSGCSAAAANTHLISAFFSDVVVDRTRHFASSSEYGPAAASVDDNTSTDKTAHTSATAFFIRLLLASSSCAVSSTASRSLSDPRGQGGRQKSRAFSFVCSVRLQADDQRPAKAGRYIEIDIGLILGGPHQMIDHQRVEFDARGVELQTQLLLYGGEDRRG